MKKNEFEQILKFYNLLQDDESKKLYVARYSWMMEKNTEDLINVLFDPEKKYTCTEVMDFFKGRDKEKVIIYGCGVWGKYTYKLLQNLGIKVTAFLDNNVEKQELGYCGVPVYSPEILQYQYRDYVVVLGTVKYIAGFYDSLLRMKFPRENILWPNSRILFATCGNQYFDLEAMEKADGEVFVDAGALNLNTTQEFVKWCGGNYDKVYVFEPDGYNAEVCRKKAEAMNAGDKIEILQCGTWSFDTVLRFHNGAAGASKITDKGNVEVRVNSIDNVLAGRKCTFIKLDVEGAELETLKGAINTIKTWHPKLAISIYHKPEDIVQIPQFLMENFEGYKFYIRHYSSKSAETVLYAI